jgi:hypothetical protein
MTTTTPATTNQSETTHTEALKRTIEATTGMPAANVAKGGRSLDEEAARFLQDAQAAAARRDK